MRAVIVHNRYRSANPSGENRVVETDIDQLRADGVEVEPYVRDSDEIDHFGPAAKLGVAARPVYSPGDVRAFSRLLARFRPDVVHLHNPYPLISPWVVRTADFHGVPVVQTVNNYRHVCTNGTLFRDGAHCTECVDRRLPWPAVRHGCYQDSRLRAVPMAVALTVHRTTWTRVRRFLAAGPAVVDHLERLGIPADRIVLRPNAVPDPGPPDALGAGALFLGRLVPEKGIALLLDAWERSGVGRNGHTLRIAGDGELRDLVARAAARDTSIEALGLLDHDGVRDAVRRAALVVVPSIWDEPDGMVAVQAWASGRPTLTTTRVRAAAPELEEVTAVNGPAGGARSGGWQVPPNVDALAVALSVCLGDRAGLEAAAVGARTRYRAQRSPDHQTRLVDVYREIVS